MVYLDQTCSIHAFFVGRGTPAELIRASQAIRIPDNAIPTLRDAVLPYEGEGGALSRVSQFGRDPAEGYSARQLARKNAFMQRYRDFGNILADATHGLWQAVLR